MSAVKAGSPGGEAVMTAPTFARGTRDSKAVLGEKRHVGVTASMCARRQPTEVGS